MLQVINSVSVVIIVAGIYQLHAQAGNSQQEAMPYNGSSHLLEGFYEIEPSNVVGFIGTINIVLLLIWSMLRRSSPEDS